MLDVVRCRFVLVNSHFNSSIQPIDSSVQPVNPSIQPINSSIQPINSSTRRFNPSTHQPIDSTHQPGPLGTLSTASNNKRWNPSTFVDRDLLKVSWCSLLFRARQLIYPSTHQPMALRHFPTRPGGLHAARLNPPPAPKGRE